MLPVCAALPLCGCAPHGSLHLIPLGDKRLNPTGELLRDVKPAGAYHWTDEEGRLCLAFHREKNSLLGKEFDRRFSASLVLGAPPAGAARTYKVDRRTLRHLESAGFVHLRSASLSGLVTVWDYDKHCLRGRLRLVAKQQSFWVLTGWGGDTQVLWVGEFTALPDAVRGKAVLDQTEEGTMSRAETPTLRPPPSSATPPTHPPSSP